MSPVLAAAPGGSVGAIRIRTWRRPPTARPHGRRIAPDAAAGEDGFFRLGTQAVIAEAESSGRRGTFVRGIEQSRVSQMLNLAYACYSKSAKGGRQDSGMV